MGNPTQGIRQYRKHQLTPTELESFRQFIRRKSREPGNEGAFDYLLVELGDEAMIEKYAREKFRGDGVATVRLLFAKSGSPKAVEALVPHLLKEEPYERYGGDVPSVPISFFAAAAIPMTLGNSPSFGPEVIQWAQRINHPGGHIEYPEIREVMRDWWRANEHHFKAKDYKAVQPGREPKVIPPPEPIEVVTAPAETPAPAASGPPKTVTTTIPRQPKLDASWLGFAIDGGCAVLLAAGLAFVARQGRRG